MTDTSVTEIGPVERFMLDHEAPLAWDDPDAAIAFAREQDRIRQQLVDALRAAKEWHELPWNEQAHGTIDGDVVAAAGLAHIIDAALKAAEETR